MKIKLLQATGHSVKEIAQALDVTQPTLRKHYFHQLKNAGESRLRVKGEMLANLWQAAAGGNVGALKQIDQKILQAERAQVEREIDRAAPKAPPKGKKEKIIDDARSAGGEGTGWGDLLGPSTVQ